MRNAFTQPPSCKYATLLELAKEHQGVGSGGCQADSVETRLYLAAPASLPSLLNRSILAGPPSSVVSLGAEPAPLCARSALGFTAVRYAGSPVHDHASRKYDPAFGSRKSTGFHSAFPLLCGFAFERRTAIRPVMSARLPLTQVGGYARALSRGLHPRAHRGNSLPPTEGDARATPLPAQ